jgi:hypothetical protein
MGSWTIIVHLMDDHSYLAWAASPLVQRVADGILAAPRWKVV